MPVASTLQQPCCFENGDSHHLESNWHQPIQLFTYMNVLALKGSFRVANELWQLFFRQMPEQEMGNEMRKNKCACLLDKDMPITETDTVSLSFIIIYLFTTYQAKQKSTELSNSFYQTFCDISD